MVSPLRAGKEYQEDCRYIIKENYAAYYSVSEADSYITILHVRDTQEIPMN
jgi:hypothetical protein